MKLGGLGTGSGFSPPGLARSSASPQDISGYVTESLIMGITGWPVSKVASFLRMYGKYL